MQIKDKSGKNLTSKEIISKIAFRLYAILVEFELMVLRIAGCIPCHHLRRFFYRAAGIKIGKGTSVHMFASFYNPHNIEIGNDSIIGEGVVLDGRDKLTIGNHVDIASEVMIYNAEHDINDENFKPIFAPVVIEDYVFIGPRAIILPGIKIKKGAVVAAGAVVVKDVDEFTVVGGVPAELIGQRKVQDLKYKLGRSAWFR